MTICRSRKQKSNLCTQEFSLLISWSRPWFKERKHAHLILFWPHKLRSLLLLKYSWSKKYVSLPPLFSPSFLSYPPHFFSELCRILLSFHCSDLFNFFIHQFNLLFLFHNQMLPLFLWLTLSPWSLIMTTFRSAAIFKQTSLFFSPVFKFDAAANLTKQFLQYVNFFACLNIRTFIVFNHSLT